MMTTDELWWRRVPVAEKVVKNTRDSLLDGKSIQIFPDLIWKEMFLEQVFYKIKNIDPSITVIDFDGRNMDDSSSLIDTIAEQLGFGFNFDGFLDTLILHLQNGRFIWKLHDLSPKLLKETHQLVRELPKKKAHITIILEDDTPKPVKSLLQVKLNITSMDIHYFAWTLLMEQENVPLIEYAAILCEELSNGDLEKCAYLCGHIHDLMQRAASVCNWFSESDLQQLIHVAQLRGIQPVIEEQRLKFIERLGNRINRIIPFTDEYNSVFSQPQEVELRHLIHYRNDLSLKPAESDELNRLYNARNDLSHLRILSDETIRELSRLANR